MTSEVKLFAICACGVAAVVGCVTLNDILEKRQELKELEAKNALELEKAKLEGTYPPEYWTAKAAEAEANAKVRQASIESEERLKLDARDREKAEKKLFVNSKRMLLLSIGSRSELKKRKRPSVNLISSVMSLRSLWLRVIMKL